MLDLVRLPNWPDRLLDLLDTHRAAAFDWGTFDCVTLYADALRAITGVDPLALYRPRVPWRSDKAALKALLKTGFHAMPDLVAAQLPLIAPGLARRGDVGYPAARTPLMGPAIIIGAEAVSRDENGWIVLPTASLTLTYKVG